MRASAKPKPAEPQPQPSQAEMWIEWVPLRELATWPSNPKEHDLATLGESLTRFGFVEPIVFDEGTQKIVAGHGRREQLLGMMRAGQKPPARVRVRPDGEWLVPVLRGVRFESELEAEAYLLASNQTVMRAGYDDRLLADMLKRHGEDMAGLGWDQDDVSALVERVNAMDTTPPPPDAPQDFKDYDEGQKRTHSCPQCGFHVVCDE